MLIADFAVSADNKIKLKESERRINILTVLENFKKSIEHEGSAYTYRDWWIRNSK